MPPSPAVVSLTDESTLRALAFIDVDEQVVPADDPLARVPKRKATRLKPPVDAVETPRAYLELEGVA
jgi:hypothetical protein